MISSVIPARLEFSCGHAALVSLPRLKGETATQRTERIVREKTDARGRACDFCGPREQVLLEVRPVQAAVPSGAHNGHPAADAKEKVMHTAETPSVTRLGAEETRRSFPPRRRLDDAQEREVARLYAETMMPVPDISKQFSIGESSVYRIAQRRGVGLRGRIAGAQPVTPPAPAPPAPATTTARRQTRAAATTAPKRARAATAPPTPAPTRRRARVAAAPPTPVSTRTRTAPTVVRRTTRQRFQIRFHAEAVVQAADIRAALRQLESLGATDVIAIVRQDR